MIMSRVDPLIRPIDGVISTSPWLSRESTLMSRIFAIPAIGFGTVDFFDDKEDHPEDKGLVTWLSCTVSNHTPPVISRPDP